MAAEEKPSDRLARLDEEPEAAHDVAVFNEGDTQHNTIVLGGVDVVIPLELDMDGDPFQDDEVCLRSIGGHWESVLLSSDAEVTASRDQRHLYYEFRDVPSGVYEVDVRIADHWITVIKGLLVSQGKVRVGDQILGEDPPSAKAAVDDPHVLVDTDAPDEIRAENAADDHGCAG